ncbi:large subunit GTPase 1, partial [Trifolium medium]|nr:large subunit GTPase 1 [Trifolium medium]
MGKNQKTELGRALVKQHNQMIQQTKEKGRIYKKKFLESFTEVSDIDAIIEQADEDHEQELLDLPLPPPTSRIN